ncbi:MAG: LysM peptidoglycan-binding domain-containing protein [Anaerolineales bacterium]|nr:LysM peptidoglycan-binding domain-containing protein [Anaerolineales bacterium]MBP6209844.1 LysM peptidoglycan-binding domain-containing protein [Anaerolineales bacterium]MBP8164143.1 LysM peptidoglycan-binding domain-containing protein [Anaerolineales bacterium]
MNPKRFFILIILVSLLLTGLWLPANAAPSAQQQIPTPTAGADGRIIYVVQAGDSCIRVAALNGISQEVLRQLNSTLDENCTLFEGQELLIGLISQAGTPTAGPSPTPAPPTPSPTPFTGTTEVCVLLFEDSNGNALREETEPAVSGGAVSVTENNGEYSASLQTTIPADPEAYQGVCFSDVPEGNYNITVGIPDNYNPTMNLNYSLDVKAGDQAFVNFGAQSKDVVMDPGANQPAEEETTSPLFGIIGGLLLLGGAVLGYYAWRSGKPESKLSGGNNILR